MRVVTLERAIEILKHYGRDFDHLMADENYSFFLHAEDGRLLAVNETVCRKLGYPHEKMMKLTIDQWENNFNPDTIKTHWAVLPVNQPLRFFGIHRRSNNGQFPVAMNAWVLELEGDRILYSQAWDLSETRDVIENLQRSEQRFRTIFDGTQEAVFIHDISGPLLDVNAKACDLLGYTRHELMSLPPPTWIDPENFDQQPEILQALKSGNTFEKKTRMRCKDGRAVPVDCKISLLILDGREAFLVMANDISERVRHEQEVERLMGKISADNEKLRELSHMKDNFLSVISHELRTPLTSVVGYIKLLLGQMGQALDEDTRREYLRTALSNADRLFNLVNDLLDISRLEEGRLKMYPEPAAVVSVLENSLKAVDILIRQKSLRLEMPGVPAEWRMVADAPKIERVLINLLGNAVKFSPPEGGLRVRVSRQNGDLQPGYLFAVGDDGPGIPPEELRHVFEKFYQVENPLTRKAGGTGLGLAIAQGIVEAHGGSIWAENAPQGGCIMKFFLPEGPKAV